jgi:hypothetical protein
LRIPFKRESNLIKLPHSKFIIRNCLQPDGDAVRLKPDNIDFVKSSDAVLIAAISMTRVFIFG